MTCWCRGQRRMTRLLPADREPIIQTTTHYTQGMQKIRWDRTAGDLNGGNLGYLCSEKYEISGKTFPWSDFLLLHSDGRVWIWCKKIWKTAFIVASINGSDCCWWCNGGLSTNLASSLCYSLTKCWCNPMEHREDVMGQEIFIIL